MSWRISIPQRIARRCEGSSLSKVNSKEGEWLIQCSTVDHKAPYNVFYFSASDRRCETLDNPKSMGILPRSLSSKCAQIVKSTILIKVMIINEFNIFRHFNNWGFQVLSRDNFLGRHRWCLCLNVKHLFCWGFWQCLAHNSSWLLKSI